MATVLAILEWLFLLLCLPFAIFSIIAIDTFDAIYRTFHPQLLISSIFTMSAGIILSHQIPSEDAKFIGLLEALADTSIAGIGTPFALMIIALVLFLVSGIARMTPKGKAND